MASQEIDPITLQVISGALDTIAEEMGHILYRMSFSSIIRESQDLGAGLFDTEFNTLCESESTPLHIGSLPGYLEGIRASLQGGVWHEGDVVIHNHPYYGSSHSPDIAIVIPAFHEGELVAFSANTAHHLDIGAATPGLIIDIPDVYAEGMLFAGTKLYERGVRNEALWEYIGRNSRAARQLQDDLDAQIASARLGVRRFGELLERYGKETVLSATHQLMDYTERVLRQRIAAIPDGEYRAEGWLDDDGRNRDVRLPIKVCVRVKATGSRSISPAPRTRSRPASTCPSRARPRSPASAPSAPLLLDAETSEIKVPSNQGSFRPIDVIAPKGSIFNPKFPAAAEARFSQINRVIDLIYKALAPVLPNDIIAGSSATLSFAAYSGVKPNGEYWVFLEVNEGSYGGRPASDGPDSIDNLMANTRNNPLEDLATHLPMICDRYELRDDVMPGAGRYRGGIGVVKKQRVLTSGFITHECDRHPDVPGGSSRHAGQCGGPPDLQRRPPRRHPRHARQVRRASGLRRRRDGLLRPLRGRLRRSAGAAARAGAGRRARRFLHGRACPAGLRSGGGSRYRRRRPAATEALRSRMRADPRRGEREDSRSATIDRRGDGARPGPRAARAESAADPSRVTSPGERPPAAAPDTTARRMSPLPAASPAGAPPSKTWWRGSTRVSAMTGASTCCANHRNGGGIEVVAELEANGTRVQRTGASKGNGRLPLGAQLEIASEAAFRSCAAEMLGEAGRISV